MSDHPPQDAPGGGDLVSVVITNYNRRDDLRAALQSIRRQDYPHVEIIVTDNDSHDGSADMVRAEFPEVRLLALRENTGMDGYSIGFREARGTYVFQMDNDSEMPDPTVLSEVVRRFKTGPANLGVVATRVEEFRPGGPDLETLRARDTRRGPINVRSFHSGGVGFLRRALDEIGGYNRDVFLYCSELFLEIKFLAAGYAVLTYPEILMLHKGSGVSRSKRFFYYHIRNRYWFMRRFATPWQRLRFFPRMLVYDFGLTLWNRMPGTYFKAVYEGFGRMPDSLRGKVRSSERDYLGRIDDVGNAFRVGALVRRARQVLTGR